MNKSLISFLRFLHSRQSIVFKIYIEKKIVIIYITLIILSNPCTKIHLSFFAQVQFGMPFLKKTYGRAATSLKTFCTAFRVLVYKTPRIYSKFCKKIEKILIKINNYLKMALEKNSSCNSQQS